MQESAQAFEEHQGRVPGIDSEVHKYPVSLGKKS